MPVSRRLLLACLATVLPALLPAAAPAAEDLVAVAERETLRMYLPDDMLVESATRVAKPLSQVAENVTIVRAQDIEEMNAHTVAEVLNRVTGVFVQSIQSFQYGALALPHIQGSGESNYVQKGFSMERDVTLLLDGIPWNQVSSGSALLGTIPLGIIDKIEIIKGPASSTWGSALGGVINIITKKAGNTPIPQGQASVSYGQHAAFDGRAEISGGTEKFGYFLYGDRQAANWDQEDAKFTARSLFGKFEVRPSKAWRIGLTVGTSRPEISSEALPDPPASRDSDFRTFVGSLSVDGSVSDSVTVHVNAYKQRLRQSDDVAATGLPWNSPLGVYSLAQGELFVHQGFDEKNTGAQAHVAYTAGWQTLVVGAEYFKTDAEDNYQLGPTLWQFYSDAYGDPNYPARLHASSPWEKYGIYVNDTLRLGPVSVTPGLRYDDTSRTDPFWSPSLGAIWRAAASTLVRAQVSRGFTAPTLSYLAGSSGASGNPGLDPEKVWSFQAGVETTLIPALWLKVTAFHHIVSDYIDVDPNTGGWVNTEKVKRTGLETELQTAAFWGISAKGGLTYVHLKPEDEGRIQNIYQSKGGLSYRSGTFLAELFGTFVWWDLGEGSHQGRSDDSIWDLLVQKTVLNLRPVDLDLFGQVHNLFNGRQYDYNTPQNPRRWVEGGVRVRF